MNINIIKGTSRTVFVFDKLAFKFPRIHIRRAVKRIYHSLKGGYFWKSIKWGPYSYVSPMRFLFKGLFDNWLEFYYYQKIKSPFLQPTYFSFFGLVNIQKTGKKPSIAPDDFVYQLLEMTNGETLDNGHVFENRNNFCEDNGHLRILDYGGRNIYDFLCKWGDKIYADFNFSYSREKRQR